MKIFIDHHKNIIGADHLWDKKADENEASNLKGDAVKGINLLHFIKGDSFRMFIEAMLTRVFIVGKPYILHYRCDSGNYAQFMQMIVQKERDDIVSMEHELLKKLPLNKYILFTEDATAVEKRCSICGKVSFKNNWYDALTHRNIFGTLQTLKTASTICPACEQDHSSILNSA